MSDRSPEPRRLLGVREVCETLGISEPHLRALRRSGRFPAPTVRLMGETSKPKWRPADVDAVVSSLAAEHSKPQEAA